MLNKILFFLILLSGILYSEGEETVKFLPGVKITGIAKSGNEIWFSSNGKGVFRYNTEDSTWKQYSTENGLLQNDFVYTIAADGNYVYAGSVDGLFMMNRRGGRWMKRKFGKGGQLSNWIRSIKYDPYSDLVWIGRFMYLTYFDISKRRFEDIDLTVDDNFKTNTIKAIAVDGDSLVWFGTEDGLHKYDKSRRISDERSLIFYDNRLNYFNGEGENVSVSDILFEQNNVWIGLDEFVTKENPDYNAGGLYKFDRKNEWTKFATRDGLRAEGIYALERAGNYIWVSTYKFDPATKEEFGRGVSMINIMTDEVTPLYDEEIPSTVRAMLFDGESMWFGSDNGVVKLKLYNELAEWKEK